MNALKWSLVPAIFLSFAPYAPVSAATIAFEGSGQSLDGARIEEGGSALSSGELLGLVGDAIELGDGSHPLRVVLPNGYRQEFRLDVSGVNVAISQTREAPGNCSKLMEVTWEPPQVEHLDGRRRVLIDNPSFGQELGRGPCMQPMMFGCTKQKVILTVSSMPTGAGVWIDGQESAKTDTVLSVPYCKSEDRKTILVRYPNSPNCRKVVQDLAPDKEINVHCDFKPVTATPAPAMETKKDCSVAEQFFCQLTGLCVCKP